MKSILYLVLFQVVTGVLLSEIREVLFKAYLKERKYYSPKKGTSEKLAQFLLMVFRMAVPIFGLAIVAVILFVPDEELLAHGIKKDLIRREEQ